MSKIKVPRPNIIATLAAESADAERRTVDVVFYSGATVPRFSWLRGEYLLTFSMDKGAIRLGSLNSGTSPVLETHSDWSTRDVLGVIEKGWLEDGQAKATMRFAQNDPDADRVWNKIEQQVLRNVSMGVRIHKMKETSGSEDKVKSYLATDWEPFEISVVPIGADPGAHIQMSAPEGEQEVEVEEFAARATSPGETTTMEQNAITGAGDGARTETQQQVDEARLAERKRVQDINETVARFRVVNPQLDLAALAAEHIGRDTTAAEFQRLAIARAAELSAQNPTQGHHSTVQVLRDGGDTMRAGMINCLLHRVAPAQVKLEAGREYMGESLLEMAKACLQARGVPYRGKDKMQVAQLAFMQTGDFPFILANVAGKRLRAGYEESPRTFTPWASRGTAPDFKQMSIVSLGSAPNLELVAEGASFKTGSLPESREVYNLVTYGKILPITRQAIVNDDLRAFSRIPQLQGAACARLENVVVYGILTANANMSDGAALFVAGHANLVNPGTVINIANLGIARRMMRVQTGIANADGTAPILNITMRFLIVPAALEMVALQYTTVAGIQSGLLKNLEANVNPFAGTLTPVVEPLLDATSPIAWYGAADPAAYDTVEYCYLEGAEGPQYETRVGFEVDGMEFKVRQDFAAKALDWRGLIRNDGA